MTNPNMTPQQRLMVDFTAVVTLLAEETGPVPASSIYMALEWNMSRFEAVKMLLMRTNTAKVTSNTLMATDEGRKVAEKLATIKP